MDLRAAASLAALLTLVSASPARAGERMNLTELLAPLPQVGDYKVFVEDSGAWVREEVLAVEEAPGVKMIRKRYVDAEGDEALLTVYVEPGVEVYPGFLSRGPGELPGFLAELAGPARSLSLSVNAKGATRVAQSWFDTFFALFITRFRLRGEQRVAEIGPLETPYASHAEAALVESRTHVRSLRFVFGRGFENAHYEATGWMDTRRVSSWFVEGIGLVGETGLHRTYKRGALRGAAAYEIWLREGVIRGVPYP